MTDFLDELEADLMAADAERKWPKPKPAGVTVGGSRLFGCRAETVLKLNKVPPSDPRFSYEAFVGSAIDEKIGQARLRRHPQLLVQEQFVYRNVLFVIDEYNPDTKTLLDWKTKNTAAACKKAVRWMEQGIYDAPQKRAQLHGGAAALIEAGYQVDTIQLVFLPRAGGFEGACTFSEPFNRVWADRGVDWAADVLRIAEGPDFGSDIPRFDELRDKDESFCWKFCAYVSTCRGPW